MAAVVAPVCAAALRQWIDDSLQLCMHANAVFLCERLYYASPTEEVSSRAGDRSAAVQSGILSVQCAYLLGICYIRNNEAFRTYSLLKSCTSAQNKYRPSTIGSPH